MVVGYKKNYNGLHETKYANTADLGWLIYFIEHWHYLYFGIKALALSSGFDLQMRHFVPSINCSLLQACLQLL